MDFFRFLPRSLCWAVFLALVGGVSLLDTLLKSVLSSSTVGWVDSTVFVIGIELRHMCNAAMFSSSRYRECSRASYCTVGSKPWDFQLLKVRFRCILISNFEKCSHHMFRAVNAAFRGRHHGFCQLEMPDLWVAQEEEGTLRYHFANCSPDHL